MSSETTPHKPRTPRAMWSCWTRRCVVSSWTSFNSAFTSPTSTPTSSTFSPTSSTRLVSVSRTTSSLAPTALTAPFNVWAAARSAAADAGHPRARTARPATAAPASTTRPAPPPPSRTTTVCGLWSMRSRTFCSTAFALSFGSAKRRCSAAVMRSPFWTSTALPVADANMAERRRGVVDIAQCAALSAKFVSAALTTARVCRSVGSSSTAAQSTAPFSARSVVIATSADRSARCRTDAYTARGRTEPQRTNQHGR